jgi:hypothetical protein
MSRWFTKCLTRIWKVHVWEIDSTSFIKRLDVLERRAAGNWMTDLEEHAVEFESDFMVIPRCIDVL